MSFSAYLASKYLTAEPAHPTGKKRKRKDKLSLSNSLIIADDDIPGWSTDVTKLDQEETVEPTQISSDSGLRKAKKNAWRTVGGPKLLTNKSDAEEADQIIAQAVAEKSAALQQDEEPVLIDGISKMQDGSSAGLQSASEVKKALEKHKKDELAALKSEGRSSLSKKNLETVYRDATGRRIDLTLRRQEAQREAKLKAAKEREAFLEQNGDVQRAQKQKEREMLDEARFLPLTRTIDDEEMNKQLKEKDRWNDPASKFLSKPKNAKSVSGKPLYNGPAAPNRYGIRPGHRWDGVDRGNGWEARRFKALNSTTRNRELNYSWQTDV